MSVRNPAPWRRLASVFGVVALLLRLAFPAVAMPAGEPADSGLQALLGDVPVCHGGASADDTGPAPHHPTHDCALCPACDATTPSALLPSPGVAVAGRVAAGSGPVSRATATRPPRFGWRDARPRGPPGA